MSNQPKPATGEIPKAWPAYPEHTTTGEQEWTARKAPTGYIAALYSGNTEIYRQPLDYLEDLQRVSDAHNAALALKDEALQANRTYTEHIEQQLDAEREKQVTALCPFCHGSFVVEQTHVYEIQQLRGKMDAAREALKWLQDELKGDEYFVEKIDIALVKMGMK